MASFSYKGLKDNKYIDGVLDAEDRDEAVYKLKNNKVIISGIREIKAKRESLKSSSWNIEIGSSKIPSKEILLFTKVMSTMLSAGINVLEALRLSIEQTKNKQLKAFVNDCIESVLKTFTFWLKLFISLSKTNLFTFPDFANIPFLS